MKQLLAGVLLFLCFQLAGAQEIKAPLAWEYYHAGEYAKAAPIFLKTYEENQVQSYLLYYINCLVELKDYETAIKTVKKAIRQTGDIILYVNLGFLYETSGDANKAKECYQEPLKEFPQTLSGIVSLGNAYMVYLQTQYAEMTYEFGRKILGNPEEFRMEMANVYYAERRFPAMLDEYFALLLNQPQYLPTVEAMIENALNYDVDQTLMQMTHDKTYSSIQQLPGVAVFYDLLVWVLIKEGNYLEAVEQTIAMDRRSHASGERTLDMARTAADEGDPDAALKAYSYLIDQGPEIQPVQPGLGMPVGSVYRIARIEYLLTQVEKERLNPETNSRRWQSLSDQITQTLNDLGKSAETGQLFLEQARIRSDYLNDYAGALAILDEAVLLPGIHPGFRTDCILLKGDVLLASGDPWEANFAYAMTDLENPDNPSGATARFRKAQLAWFTGNISWAMAQLDVLKGSTSKPIANDAFELSLLIRENESETDTAQVLLKELAGIDYLIFRKKWAEALVRADSLLRVSDPDEPSLDDILYKKGNILFQLGETAQAMQAFEVLADRYRYEYWGHKALFQLACLNQDQLKEKDKAITLFEEFIRDFPNSFYFLDARDRLKSLLQQIP